MRTFLLCLSQKQLNGFVFRPTPQSGVKKRNVLERWQRDPSRRRRPEALSSSSSTSSTCNRNIPSRSPSNSNPRSRRRPPPKSYTPAPPPPLPSSRNATDYDDWSAQPPTGGAGGVDDGISPFSQAFAMALVLPVLHGIGGFVFIQLYGTNTLAATLIPAFRTYLGVLPRDVPAWTLAAAAVHAYAVSSVVAGVLKSGSKEGWNVNHPRLDRHTGIVHRASAAHQNAVESLPLMAAAVLLSAQANVSLTIRSQFMAYAFIARMLQYFLYLINFSFLRTLAWVSFSVPCYILIAAAALPGFAKEYLQTNPW
ncbi:hypothetical protein DFJ73DRAFT_137229 [Zopfochytrium polystomum]|nr:hypothetical protein DFJ73DRAFT_137229 [Zopfochytrium polystomum]